MDFNQHISFSFNHAKRITATHFQGRVQGVGFRWRVMQVAKLFPCTGYVKNLMDGSVELLVERGGE